MGQYSGKTICYTSFSFSYLARARILLETVRMAHPEWIIWALVTDEVPEGIDSVDLLKEFDFVINAKDLGFIRYRAWMFKHDVVEACTAVKGRMLARILDYGPDNVVYLDPDIAVFNPLDSVVRLLDVHSIILTPHQVESNNSEMAIQDNEITALKYGVFNLGFVAVKNNHIGRAFATWWDSHLVRACYDDIQNGLFTDQKYCDLVPALFDQVFVYRDAGANVASWNLSRRAIKFSRNTLGQALVNDSPLKFYHFTKFGGIGLNMTERYGGDNVEVYELWQWYQRMMRKLHVSCIPERYWHFGTFANGVKIPKRVREFYRSRLDLMAFFDDPYSVDGNSLYHWIAREEPKLFATFDRVSNL